MSSQSQPKTGSTGRRLRGSAGLIASLVIPLAAAVALVVFVREPASWQAFFGHRHDHRHAAGGSELPAGPHGGMVADAGRGLLELLIDDRNGTAHLFVSSKTDGSPHPVAPLAAELRLTPAPGGFSQEPIELRLLPLPTADDPAGAVSRFIASGATLTAVDVAEAIATIVTLTATLRAEFTLAGGDRRAVYVCPMRCDNGKSHPEPGNCPSCGMALRAAEDAHADHRARHGGTLLMAADGFHHVEGVLHTPREFRLYVYNDFTQPISATRLLGRAAAEVVSLDEAALGSVTAPLRGGEGGRFLWLPVPEQMSRPLEIRLRLSFPGRSDADRFDFVFRGAG